MKHRWQYSLQTAVIVMLLYASVCLSARSWKPWGVRSVIVHGIDFNDAVLSGSGEIAVTAEGPRVCLWNARTGRPERDFGAVNVQGDGGSPRVLSVSLSPDERVVATAFEDGTVCVYETASGLLARRFSHPARTALVRFFPDGKRLAVACDDSAIYLWNVRDGIACGKLPVYSEYVRRVEVSSDGSRVATTADLCNGLELWDPESLQRVETFDGGRDSPFGLSKYTVDFSPSGPNLLLNLDNDIILWNPQTKQTTTVKRDGFCTQTIFLSDSRIAVGKSVREGTDVVDIASGAVLATLPVEGYRDPYSGSGDAGTICCLSCSQDGNVLLAATAGGRVTIWERRHPESWWGHFYRPEVWLTILFGSLWLWRVVQWTKG